MAAEVRLKDLARRDKRYRIGQYFVHSYASRWHGGHTLVFCRDDNNANLSFEIDSGVVQAYWDEPVVELLESVMRCEAFELQLAADKEVTSDELVMDLAGPKEEENQAGASEAGEQGTV